MKVKVTPTDVVLKPGQSQKLEVTIERAPGFDKNITLDLIYKHLAAPFGNSLPAGVTIDDKQSKTLLTAKETSGHIRSRPRRMPSRSRSNLCPSWPRSQSTS